MHLASLLVAALPALALAQEAPPAVSSTVTQTSVTTMTKTVVLSRLSTVTSTAEANVTSFGSIGTTSYSVMPTGAASPSTAFPSPPPGGPTVNAAGSLDANRVALAGLAAILAAAML